jgi:hypothetical protein
MAVTCSRDEGSLTTGGGGFRTIPLLERSVPGLDIDLASDAGAAQVKDDVLVDTPPAGEDRGDGEGDAPRSNHLVGHGQVNVRRGDHDQEAAGKKSVKNGPDDVAGQGATRVKARSSRARRSARHGWSISSRADPRATTARFAPLA